MKIKPGFILRDIDNQTIVIPVGTTAAKFNGMITLRGTGKFLWELLNEEQTEESLLQAVLANYDVAEAIAASDIKSFLGSLREAELLSE